MELLQNPFRLGFGLMRLPKLADGGIDLEQVSVMADHFLAAGGTYFDTAYVYDGGKSEEAFRKTVAERYPRNAYTIATKLMAAAQGIQNEEDARQVFFTSLNRLGTGTVDYYLLHAIQRSNIQKYNDFHLWEFVRELKEKGLIKHWGFSFHADSDLLEELLNQHPDAEFVQLQINYADWENPGCCFKKKLGNLQGSRKAGHHHGTCEGRNPRRSDSGSEKDTRQYRQQRLLRQLGLPLRGQPGPGSCGSQRHERSFPDG